MLVEGEADNGGQVGIERDEAIHGRPEALAVDRQNHLLKLVAVLDQVNILVE